MCSSSRRRVLCWVLPGVLVVFALAGCEALGLVEPIGSAGEPEERVAEFRVRVEFIRAEGNNAPTLDSLTIRMPVDGDAPDDAGAWPYDEVYQFDGRTEHGNTESAYVKAFSGDENEAFTVRIRYWDTGTEPETLVFERTVESRPAGGNDQGVQTSFAVPR